MSCLPVPPGPSGAPRCLLTFHPIAWPGAAVPVTQPPGASARPAPSGGAPAAPPEANASVDARAGADAALGEDAGRAANPASSPSTDAAGAAAAGAPLPLGAGAAQGGASTAETAGRASSAGDASPEPDPDGESAAAAQQDAAEHVLRGMAVVDGIAAGSPYQRCSIGFQARYRMAAGAMRALLWQSPGMNTCRQNTCIGMHS